MPSSVISDLTRDGDNVHYSVQAEAFRQDMRAMTPEAKARLRELTKNHPDPAIRAMAHDYMQGQK